MHNILLVEAGEQGSGVSKFIWFRTYIWLSSRKKEGILCIIKRKDSRIKTCDTTSVICENDRLYISGRK